MNNVHSVFEKNWRERTVFVFLATCIFLVYLSPFWSFEDSSRSVSLIRITLFLTSFLMVLELFGKLNLVSNLHIKIAPLNLSLFLLFLYLFFNAFLMSESLQPARRLVLYLLLFSPFLLLSLNVDVVKRIIILIAIVISIFAAYSIVNQYFKGGLPSGYRKGELVSSGTDGVASFGNTIVAAMHYAVGYVILTYLFFTESKRFLLWFWSLLLSFVIVYIVLTFARSAWVACLVSGCVIYILTFSKRKARFYIIPILAFLAASYFLMNFASYEVGERGLTYRDEVWKNVVEQINGHWLLGYGLSTPLKPITIADGLMIVNNSHNVYLEIIYQVGLIGLFLYLVTLISAIYILFKSYLFKVYGSLSILLLAALISISVVMLIEMNSWIHTPNLLWMWLWVPLALTLSFENKLTKLLRK